jgi:hypothetical protein
MTKGILILKISAVLLFSLSAAIVFFLLRDIGEIKSGGGKNLYVFFSLFTAVVCFVKAFSFQLYPRWKRLLSILPIRWWGLRILGITYMYFIFYLLITSDVDMAETFRVLMVLALLI